LTHCNYACKVNAKHVVMPSGGSDQWNYILSTNVSDV